MPISETVRLVIELPGSQQALRILRQLGSQTERLRTTFTRAGSGSRSFSAQAARNLDRLSVSLRRAGEQGKRAKEGVTFSDGESRRTVRTFRQIQQEAKKLADQQRSLATATRTQSEISKRANLVLIDFARGAQDLQFGFRAIINNFDPLILNTQRFAEAARAANGGVLTLRTGFQALFASLSGATGILLLINIVTTIGAMTGAFDGLTDSILRFLGISNDLEEFRDRVEDAARGSATFRDSIDPGDARERLAEVREEVEGLGDELDALQAESIARRVIGFAFGGLGGARSASDDINEEAEAVRVAVRNLEVERDALEDVVEGLDVERIIQQTRRETGDDIISERTRGFISQIQEAEQQIARLRTETRDDTLESIEETIRRETQIELDELARRRAILREEFFDTGNVAAIELSTALARQADAINTNLEQRITDAQSTLIRSAINAQREVEDAQARLVRDRIELEEDGVEKRIALARLEAAIKITQIEREVEDFEGSEEQRAEVAQIGADRVIAISREREQTIQQIRQDALDSERQFQERVLSLENALAVARGANETSVLQAALDRVNMILESETISEDRRRQLIIQRLQLETQIANVQRRNAEEQARLNEREIRQQERLSERIGELRRQLEVEAGAPFLDVLNTRLSELQAQLEIVDQGTTQFLRIQQEILEIQIDIAREEQRIFDERVRTFQRFSDAVTNTAQEAFERRRDITRADVDFQELQFQREENALRQSLSERRISQEAFDIEMRTLRQDRADFERQVEEDNASVISRITSSLTETIKEELRSRLSTLIATKLAELTTTQSTEAGKTAAEATGAAARRAISAGEIFDSIRSGAASMVRAVGKFISNINLPFPANIVAAAAIPALLFGLFRGARSLFGFEEGGYTGHGGSKEEAGVVHKGEFVMTKRAVKGKPGPFYALMRMLESGADPELLLSAIPGIGSLTLQGANLTGAFQEGGFASAQSALATVSAPVISGGSAQQQSDIDALREEVRSLGEVIVVTMERPSEAVADRRRARVIVREGERQTDRVKPRF
jgi:hypothetical protein